MAFSKGKRIEDETSKRIMDLAVSIGCREGTDALTVTRLCRELNCDRRVIYNRFRDVDEINMLVAEKCNEELIKYAETEIKENASYYDNLINIITAIFNGIYERNAYFQYYASLYEVSEGSIRNILLHKLEQLLEKGKASGDVKAETDCKKAAENIWLITMGVSRILAVNKGYKYHDAMDTVMYGIHAILSAI